MHPFKRYFSLVQQALSAQVSGALAKDIMHKSSGKTQERPDGNEFINPSSAKQCPDSVPLVKSGNVSVVLQWSSKKGIHPLNESCQEDFLTACSLAMLANLGSLLKMALPLALSGRVVLMFGETMNPDDMTSQDLWVVAPKAAWPRAWENGDF